MWKHPKYYTELRKAGNELAQRSAVKENREAYSGSLPARNKSDQVISETKPTGDEERASWSGPKRQAASCKRRAPSFKHTPRSVTGAWS